MPKNFSHKGLYAIIDSQAHESYGLSKILNDIVKKSTIPVIQFRLKKMDHNDKEILIQNALDLKSKRDFTLIVNDDIDLLHNPKVNGLHLGQRDIAFAMAQKTYPDKIMGLSTHDLKQAKKAQALQADYIGCGAIFHTNSKMSAIPLGLEGLREIVFQVEIPKVAIGGINLENITEVAKTGCEMAAVISGLLDKGKFVGQQLHEKFLF